MKDAQSVHTDGKSSGFPASRSFLIRTDWIREPGAWVPGQVPEDLTGRN